MNHVRIIYDPKYAAFRADVLNVVTIINVHDLADKPIEIINEVGQQQWMTTYIVGKMSYLISLMRI